MYYKHQSIGICPFRISASFAFEYGLLPKKPRYALSGLGCTLLMIVCCGCWAIIFSFACAGFPHKMNTTGSLRLANASSTASVNCSHPFLQCEFAFPSCTVSTAFNRRTPCSAHFVKLPLSGVSQPISSRNSVNILRKLGGNLLPASTEKHSPCD